MSAQIWSEQVNVPEMRDVLLCFFGYCQPISVWTRRLEARYAERG